MASAVLARSTAANGTGGGFMGKVPFSNPNPNPNFKTKKRHQQKQQKQNHHHHHQHHNEIDESPAVTQSAAASDDASSINHRRHNSSTTTEFNLNNNKQSQKQYVSFNIATYSKKQLGDLKSRLVAELDQIRQLRHQIEIQSTAPSNPNQVPPSSKKSKKLSGKKRPLPSLPLDNPIRNPNPNEASLMKACKDILTKLRKHKSGWVFNEPVDVEGMGLHDYYDIIKQPMDLGTVKSRLARDFYRSPAEFANDVRLTFTNALTYNPKGHLVHGMADQLLVRFEELFRPIGDKIDPIGKVSVSVDHHPQQQQHRAHSEQQRRVFDVDGEELQASSWNNNINIDDEDDRLDGAADDDNSMPIVEKSERIEKVSGDNSERLQAPTSSSNPPMKSAPPVKPLKQPKPKAKDPNKREMNLEEKHKLGIGLQSLPPEKMEQVVQIIRKRNGHLKQDGDEIELDIEAVDTETLWELDRLVTNWKKMVSKIKRQALMGNNMKNNGDLPMSEKIEIVASEAKKPKKGGEAGEEDVDIGDEMPMSNFPPVEIEKDVGGHASSSSSSSSSSDSDSSSSSDSDSGSSSGSDSDAADNAQS